MITKQLTNTYLIGGNPTILAIEIEYKLWLFKWRITKATKINPKNNWITNKEIEIESCKLFAE